MNEIDKINDELRNFKLFKIQRANTRRQEFDEVKAEILKTKKNDLLDYFMVFINVTSVIYLISNIMKSFQDQNFYDENKGTIFINIVVVLIASIFTSYKLVTYVKSFQKQLTSAENAIQYFSNESEVLKAEYETYVNIFLQKK